MKLKRFFVLLLFFGLQASVFSDESNSLSDDINNRIVGGDQVDITKFPYQVSIQFLNQHFCGGALITRNTVLTAAHCFGTSYSSLSTYYEIKVGSNTTSGTAIKIQSVLVHPDYDSETIDSDICLIKLASNVTISDKVKLIRISDSDSYVTGSYASVSGWGYQSENGTVSSLLRSVDVPLTSRKQCQIYYAGAINITEKMICAGFREGGKDACQGDSGGPLVQRGRLIGLVSFGMGCARSSYPGVYTNVARLLKWVVANSNYSLNNTKDEDYFYKSGQDKLHSVRLVLVAIQLIIFSFN